jgi:hypothetical protein
MAHIANCLFDSSSGLGLNNYIARELSPQRLRDEVCNVDFQEASYSPDLEIKYTTSRKLSH